MIRSLIGGALVLWGGLRLARSGLSPVVEAVETAQDTVADWLYALDRWAASSAIAADQAGMRDAVAIIREIMDAAPHSPKMAELLKKAVEVEYYDALAAEGQNSLTTEGKARFQKWMLWRYDALQAAPAPVFVQLGVPDGYGDAATKTASSGPMLSVAAVGGGLALIATDKGAR